MQSNINKSWININLANIDTLRTYVLMFCWVQNRFDGVMVSVLASSAGDCWFEPRSGQNTDSIWCFSAKHVVLRRKIKDWLVVNQNNVSEWSDMSIRGLLFQWASTMKSQFSLVQNGHHHRHKNSKMFSLW